MPTCTEPFWEVIHQYTNTLCTTQKQANLTNSLLQDIPVFNEYDSTKLEDWLMDIETGVDLTFESQAKLAKSKLRELTCTFVTEVINADKTWEEMKDLLWLKLCNANIHTYTSCFMDIQQQERNPLHHMSVGLKQKQRCNYTSQMMLPLLGFLSKDWKMLTVWQFASMIKDLKTYWCHLGCRKAKYCTVDHGNYHTTLHS